MSADVQALRPQPCGSCDGGLPTSCTCRDYRNDLDAALDEVERLRAAVARARAVPERSPVSDSATAHALAAGWNGALATIAAALDGAA